MMSVTDRLSAFLSRKTSIDSSVFIANNATVLGDVRIGADSSIWYQAVLRGDINHIQIGEGTNLQDGVICHLSDDYPVVVGNYVTVGHGAIIHACTIEDECLIGMNSTILDGAVIGQNSIVAAGTVVPVGTVVPAGSLVAGVPGVVKKELSSSQRCSIRGWAEKYIEVKEAHRKL
ncbi:MAG: gamma carbonic anhydrase family protein [Verrucomicrobiota bacterium]|nr:gamma carbonic anhydrase family protein [Verrucomicrobiota bacterium]